MSSTNQDLLGNLLFTTKPSQVQAILREIGDSPELTVNQPFGNGYHWHFVGNNESNVSTINIATKSWRSLTERVTNAIDAMFEKEMLARQGTGRVPDSPAEAASLWFGRPLSDASNGLFNWDNSDYYNRNIHVVLWPGDTRPTIDIMDRGVGIKPSDFGNSILGLQMGNKIKRSYVVGAFGQGGSATLRFSDYTLIVSRHVNTPNTIGFTVAKLMRLDPSWKVNAYVYLGMQDTDGNDVVPYFTFDDPVQIHEELPQFDTGTMVRHYGYELTGLTSTFFPSPGNLYHLFNYMMMDPLLPFTLVDMRAGKPNKETITGSRNRLMKLAAKAQDSKQGRTTLRYHSPRENVYVLGEPKPSIGIEYWVVLSYDNNKLRPYSNVLFTERHHPIIATVNGQNQGQQTAKLLRDLGLTMVSRHIIIHIDASQASKDIREQLFSSTREAFTEGPVLEDIMRILAEMLEKDTTLQSIERELEASVIEKESASTDQEVKKEVRKLLKDQGLDVREPAEGKVAGDDGEPEPVQKVHNGKRPPIELQPLPTLPYPDVTFLKIVFPNGKLSIPIQEFRTVRIETDADFRFGRENRLAIRSDPPKLVRKSEGLLKGGRMFWRLKAADDAQPGNNGQLIVTLTLPDGRQLQDSIPFEILEQPEQKTRSHQTMLPDFDIKPIDIDDDHFSDIWPELKDTDDKTAVAYKVFATTDHLIVYYSTGFGAYKRQLDTAKRRSAGFVHAFIKQYQIWIGYHAILQWQERGTLTNLASMDDEDRFQRLQDHERAIVADMQVKQAFRVADMQAKIAVKDDTLE